MSNLLGQNLYAVRGTSLDFTIRIANGNDIAIAEVTPPNQVTTTSDHCLQVGDTIAVLLPDSVATSCSTSYCQTVASVVDAKTITVNDLTVSETITGSGVVSKASDLTGFKLRLDLKAPGRQSLGLVQTEAGNKLVLVNGSCSACCASCGSELYEGMQIEIPDNVTGRLVGYHQAAENCCVLMLDTAATLTTKSAIAFTGESGSITFESTDGYEACGVLALRTDPSALDNWGSSSNGYISYGSYVLSLIRGWNYPSRYKKTANNDWSAALSTGNLYIRG